MTGRLGDASIHTKVGVGAYDHPPQMNPESSADGWCPLELGRRWCPGLPPRITVTAHALDGLWQFSVSDNGIGIEASDQDIFQIFRRLHTMDAYPGTGIGLAVCKKIIQSFGGAISVESRPGAGATFRFTLRMATMAGEAQPAVA